MAPKPVIESLIRKKLKNQLVLTICILYTALRICGVAGFRAGAQNRNNLTSAIINFQNTILAVRGRLSWQA